MKSFHICLLISFLYLGSITTYAQSDSVRTEYKVEDEKISRSEIQRLIRYITRANLEERTLIKFGGLPNAASFTQNGKSFSGGINIELAVERKWTSSFSVLIGIDNQLNAFSQRSTLLSGATNPPTWHSDRGFSFNSAAKAAIRYYYRMSRRINEGKSANNFSGTYIAIQARRPIIAYYQERQYEAVSQEVRHTSRTYSLAELNQPSFALQWGIQQRLSRRGYIDFNIGPELIIYDRNAPVTSYYDSQLQLSLRIGAIIGLGW